MAVYKRTYRGYSGELSPAWSRFLVLYRFSRQNLSRSKIQTVFFVLCFFCPLLSLLGIYANAHVGSLKFLGPQAGALFDVDGEFFEKFAGIQAALAFILTAFIGPGLVSPDLANGAVTLYLCRPLSRTEYVVGKMSVLFITLSWITWLPGLVLFVVQGSLSGPHWMIDNAYIAFGIVAYSLMWITVLSLLALALSAWVKWRIVAGALLLGVLFLGAGFAQAVNAVLRTHQGYLLDISSMLAVLGHKLFRVGDEQNLSGTEATFGLLAISAFCLYLLMRKIRANEVVR